MSAAAVAEGHLPPTRNWHRPTPARRRTRLPPLNEEAEAKRATQVGNNFGRASRPDSYRTPRTCSSASCGSVPALAPRDRSLVTVSALIASGQVAQITYHLNRAMDNGLTQPQASEVIAHIASTQVGRTRFPHFQS